VVLKADITPLLQAAADKGCTIQVGTDMLFELIPAYLEFFGFEGAAPDKLRAAARRP
jgi:shikimate dehydrogenase